MYLVISSKLAPVQTGVTPAPLDASSIMKMVTGGNATSFEVCADEDAKQKAVARRVANGQVVHVFDYLDSHRAVTSVESFKVA